MKNTNDFKNNLRAEIQKIENLIPNLVDYRSTYTNEFYTKYLQIIASAIYLEYKRQYPSLDIFIPFRQKGTKSFQKNISKALRKDYSESDENKFNTAVLKDISAMKIVLSNVPDTLSFDYNNPRNQDIIKLQKQKIDNLNFINSLQDWIYGYDENSIQDEENYYKYYVELLDRLQNSTYEECTEEVEISYAERYAMASKKYKELKEDDEFSFFVSTEQMDEMKKLLGCLERRLDDKLQNEILNVTLPNVLNSELVQKVLRVNSKLDPSPNKDNGWVRKPKGYVAIFYNLQTDSGLLIELQGQSRKRYEDDKGGTAHHNGIPGKEVKIDSFFELVDKNDPKPLEHYISLLDKIPAESLVQHHENPNIRKKALEALNHIKIKDKIQLNDDYYRNTDEYLKSFVEYITPSVWICRSAHNIARKSAGIEKKQSIEEFSDVIRKKDGVSCLAQLLIDRYESLTENDGSNIQISEREILMFAEKYLQKQDIELEV